MPIFGPNREAAKLEYSKVFAKKFLVKNNIPTSPFEIFEDVEKALSYVQKKDFPLVIKVDGLAEGKGSIICHTYKEAEDIIKRILIEREFGSAGKSIIVENFIKGFEVSFIGICDGKAVTPLETSQDHKQVFDGDKGPNTGGMGAYSPVPMINDVLFNQILDDVLKKTVTGMRNEGLVMKGVLYAGLIISGGVPYVLEFNCRFGDPETQPQMFRMKSDLLPYLVASSDGDLSSLEPIQWEQGSSICVVMSSRGYPSRYQKGVKIRGLDKVKYLDDVQVFHAGTAKNEEDIITNGGRVLGVTGLGVDLESAIKRAYKAVEMISFEGAHYRRDIGEKGINKIGGL